MKIRSSAAIRQNYNKIAEMCRKTAEPVFLTQNGDADACIPRRFFGAGQPGSSGKADRGI